MLLDARTGAVLDSQAAAERLPIASTTKLMTAYVALKELPLNKLVRAAPYRASDGESLLNLRPGQRISVRDLLYGLVMRSANDAAYDLALAAAGSERRFVHKMNLYAAALGLTDTHYANPVGLDQAGNHSSARDLATLAQHLLRIPVFARIANSRTALLRSVRPRRRISSINELLKLAPWATGVKTGHTSKAGFVLVGSGRREGVELISVVLDAPSDEARIEDSLELLERGFESYRPHRPIHVGEELADPAIRYAGGELALRAAHAVAAGTRTGQRLAVHVQAPAQVSGPIKRGTPLGRATVTIDGISAGSTALRAGRSIAAAGSLERVRGFVREHAILCAALLCVILIGTAFSGAPIGAGGDRGEGVDEMFGGFAE